MTGMMIETGRRARAAADRLARESSETKDRALHAIADTLGDARAQILAANAQDVEGAARAGLSAALVDRLTLNAPRLEAIAADLRNLAALSDPVGETFGEKTLPTGLRLRKQRVPIGVLAVIYESRPNVTIDVAGLAIKTGNAAILRGGSEALRTNRALAKAVQAGLAAAGLPLEAVQFIDDPDRARVTELLRLHEYVDLVIPRGGNPLHEFCRQNSTIPVVTGGIGICHLFVDESADLKAAFRVIRNAKIQRPTVCNALDTVLVHQNVAEGFLPELVERLSTDGVTFRADEKALLYLVRRTDGGPPAVDPSDAGETEGRVPETVRAAGPEDFDTEWLSLVLGLKVVSSLDEAMAHIAEHSTRHSDGILTGDDANAVRFVAEVDSAAVYVNASTRFTDGGQFGLGAEIAVSTQRLHARGPMGLRELTTYKWVVIGDYHVRD
jgi:glutamate-5-semialdehyde dehydrogenase